MNSVARCLLPLTLPTVLSAQLVRGKVIDASTHIGLSGATLSVVGEPNPVRSDDSGKFVMRIHRPGNVVLTAQRVGYVATTWSFAMAEKDTADATLPLEAAPKVLDTVSVTERETPAFRVADFERRRGQK